MNVSSFRLASHYMEVHNFHVHRNVIFISHLTSSCSWGVYRAGVTCFLQRAVEGREVIGPRIWLLNNKMGLYPF